MKVKSPRISDLIGALKKSYPFDLAEKWDNVGNLLGDFSQPLKGVVVAVNLGRESLAQAHESGANLIICHHPPLFKPTLKMTASSHPYCFEAIQKDICVAAFHTNFDLASLKVNQKIAKLLSAKLKGPLALRQGDDAPASQQIGKFITTVPADASDQVLDKLVAALSKAGAGQIGDYSQCSFAWPGQGTFIGGEATNPTVGKPGELQKVAEKRVEMVFPWARLERVVAAARGAHPYEEMAYDVLRLEPMHNLNEEVAPGYGFHGELSQSLSGLELLSKVQEVWGVKSVEIVGPLLAEIQGQQPAQNITRIAFSPGSGSGFIGSAIIKGVEVYITGEVGYHQMLEAKRANLSLILLGHSYSERFFVETMAEGCEDYLRGQGFSSDLAGRVKSVFEVVHGTHRF